MKGRSSSKQVVGGQYRAGCTPGVFYFASRHLLGLMTRCGTTLSRIHGTKPKFVDRPQYVGKYCGSGSPFEARLASNDCISSFTDAQVGVLGFERNIQQYLNNSNLF
jgi:hypothetical protein